MDGMNVAALAELLNPKDDGSDSGSDMAPSTAKLGPGDFGPAKKASSATNLNRPMEAKQVPDKNIWGAEEVPEGSEYEDIDDPRPQPEYDILYKQAVRSEDMFLGMNGKTPATSSCEDMVIKIKLPNTKVADAELDVKAKFLALRTPKYKLGLHLPHPVDHKNGRAQWDAATETLTVTARMIRDFDFMNF